MAADPPSSPPQQERELFLSALDKPPADRRAYLQSACAGDASLRTRIEDLLREHEQVGGFLEVSVVAAAAPGGTEIIRVVTEKPGDNIGPYKLLQQIGEGGCGVVYMAEQERPVRRRVALKVIKLGMDTRSVIARFEAERQALALMDHPNIAKVLDAGATDTGRPYFVMELVRGVRITEYCDEGHLTMPERLELFIQVCHAIQHAHQKGVIHRDIKPSNILVTLHDGVAVPKVIDFGIAKATEQRLTEKTLFTEYRSFLGTPAYTSPEQAEMSGLDIDTRSDIYSLGVLLYELLIGQTPFDPETLLRSGLDEMRRIIREDEPVQPSTRLGRVGMDEAITLTRTRRVRLPALVNAVRGDLDWIVMKCLEKDRTRRYATANDLALDVRRHLDSEPVLARPPSNLYRLQKMLHRNRGAFAAAAGIAATLIAGIAVSTWLAVRATRAERAAHSSQRAESRLRHQAESERERAELEKASARLNEYVADINLAKQSLEAGNYGRAVQLLGKHRRPPGEPDLRGFEWRFLWQASRGDPHLAFPAQDGAVQSVALSPRGDLLAAGQLGKCTVWNVSNQTLVATLPKGALSVAFFPDGSRLITASSSTVRLWNTADWKEELEFRDSKSSLSIATNGARLVTVSRQGAHVWDSPRPGQWQQSKVIDEADGPLALAANGARLVTDTRAGLTVWTLDGSRPPVVLQDSTNLFSHPRRWFRDEQGVAFSPDGRKVVAARNALSERGVFVLNFWDADTGVDEGVMPDDVEHIEHAGTITSVTFSRDGSVLATASMDHSIRVWDMNRREPLAALHGHVGEVLSVGFSADGRAIVSGGREGEIKLWSTQPQRREDILTGVRHPIAFSRDGRTLVGQTRDWSAVVFVNTASGDVEQQFVLEPKANETRRRGFGPGSGGPGTVAVSEDLRTLVLAQEDGTVRLWDTRTRQSTFMKVADDPVELVVLSPDGRTLVTRTANLRSRQFQLRSWDMAAWTNQEWRADAFRLQFSPDGRRLASTGRSAAVELWDAATLAPLHKLECEEQPSIGFSPVFGAFSPDGRLLAVPYQDDAIRLWSVTTGKLMGTFTGHKQGVRSVAFSPDGKTLATTSDDSTLKFWHVATQQELLTIRRLGATLTGLLFSPEGRTLVGGSGTFSKTGGLRFIRAPQLAETDVLPARSPAE